MSKRSEIDCAVMIYSNTQGQILQYALVLSEERSKRSPDPRQCVPIGGPARGSDMALSV
jgi:hypothetical protein